MAAVAAMGAAGAANAGFWNISGMNYINGDGPATIGTGNTTLRNGAADTSAFGGVTNTLTTDATVAGVVGTLGITLSDNTLTYFGLNNQSSPNSGSFGVAFRAVGGSMRLTFTAGPDSGVGSQGVLSSLATTTNSGDGNFDEGSFGGTFNVAANQTLVVIFGGLANGASFTLDVTRIDTGSTLENFDVSYLNYNSVSDSWNQVAGASEATKSGLNTAAYVVPVPAPMLLAGAGLIGAAALRRRMVKKA
jgi:hypothetical protein